MRNGRYFSARRGARLLLAAVLLGGLWLRTRNLAESGLVHWDEGVYALDAFGLAARGFSGTPFDPTGPPLFTLLAAAATSVLGASHAALVAPSLLAGLLAPLALHRLVRRRHGCRVALGAAALLALARPPVLYARLALTDSLFLLLFLLALDAAARAVESRRARAVGAAGLLCGAALLTKHHGFVPLLLAAAYALRARGGRPRGPGLLRLAGAAAIALLLFAPWLLYIHRTIGLEALAAHLGRAGGGFRPLAAAAFYGRYLLESTSPLLLGLSAVGLAAAARRRSAGDALLLVFALGFGALLGGYGAYPRLSLPAVAALCWAAARGAAAASRALGRRAGWRPAVRDVATAALLGAAVVAGLPPALEAGRLRADGYRAAGRWLGAAAAPDALLLLDCRRAFVPYAPRRAELLAEGGRWNPRIEGPGERWVVADFSGDMLGRADSPATLGRLRLAAVFSHDPPREVLLNSVSYDLLDRIRTDPAARPPRWGAVSVYHLDDPR